MHNNFNIDKLKKIRSVIDYYPEYSILEDIRFERDSYIMKVRISLEGIKSPNIPKQSDWYIVFYDDVTIDFYPSKNNSISATFPHQAFNCDVEGLEYRAGKPCLDIPGHALNLPKKYYPYEKNYIFSWYLERMIDWLKNASNDTLIKKGDPFEVPITKYEGIELLYKENKISDWSFFDYSYGYVKLNRINLDRDYFILEELYDIEKSEARGTIFWGDFKDRFTNNFYDSIWIKCKNFPIKQPWEYPQTWSELFSICNKQKVDVLKILTKLLAKNKFYTKVPKYLLLACPIPEKFGEEVKAYYWLMCDIPEIKYPRKGFRKGSAGLNSCLKLAFNGSIRWHKTYNWDDSVIRTRGQMKREVGDLTFAIIGVGSLGGHVAEHLVRQGAKYVKIIDGDKISIGNLSRHVLTIDDLNECKAKAMAQKLSTISPSVKIQCYNENLNENNIDVLKNCDVIIDCSGADEVLGLINNTTFDEDKEMFIGAFNYGATRFGYYKTKTKNFNQEFYNSKVTGFYNNGSGEIVEKDLIMEGIGCYHPVFPATSSDVSIWASIFVKEIVCSLENSRKDKFKFYEMEEGAIKIINDEDV